jgi:hypothetical protein
MSSDFSAAAAHVFSLIKNLPDEGTVPYDSNDALQRQYMEEMARKHGFTPERYPALFSRLRNDGAVKVTAMDVPEAGDTGSFVDNQKVDYVSEIDSGTYSGKTASHGTLTRTKEVAQAFIVLSVVNYVGDQTTVVASGALTVAGQQTVIIPTDDSTALAYPTAGQTAGVMSWSIQYTDGTSDNNHMGSYWGYQTKSDPVVTNPVQNPNRHTGDMNDIVVGLSRGYNTAGQNADVDYWFWQSQYSNTTLLVPMSGSMQFLYPIAPLGSTNPILQFYLARTEGGMSELSAGNTQPYMQCFNLKAGDPTTLEFSLLAGTNDAGNAINFGKSPWVADTQTFFTAKVIVTFQNPMFGQGWSSILSSAQPNNDPTDGVTYIKPIVYVWHCMVAGTMITLADGTTKAVENFNSGDQVRSGGGITRNVLATLAQPHYGTVLAFTFQSGKTITCSGTHPFATPNGLVQCGTLQAGAQVLTSSGTDTITNIVMQTQNGEGLFNLWLDPTAPGDTTFYANGILVGDYPSQVALLGSFEVDGNALKAKLPEYLHTDIDSYVADRLASKA